MKKKVSKITKVVKPLIPHTVKVEHKAPFFPKIYRFITESWKLILSSFASGIILIAIFIQSISLYRNLQEEQRIYKERGVVQKELAHWKESLQAYKDHRDIYFKIATLEYRLGNKDEAKINLKKSLEIDPNFEKGREMELKLEF